MVTPLGHLYRQQKTLPSSFGKKPHANLVQRHGATPHCDADDGVVCASGPRLEEVPHVVDQHVVSGHLGQSVVEVGRSVGLEGSGGREFMIMKQDSES